jgi:hypothetical protein
MKIGKKDNSIISLTHIGEKLVAILLNELDRSTIQQFLELTELSHVADIEFMARSKPLATPEARLAPFRGLIFDRSF